MDCREGKGAFISKTYIKCLLCTWEINMKREVLYIQGVSHLAGGRHVKKQLKHNYKIGGIYRFQDFYKAFVHKTMFYPCCLFWFGRLQLPNLRVNWIFFLFTDVFMSSNFLSHCDEATSIFTKQILCSPAIKKILKVKPSLWSAK